MSSNALTHDRNQLIRMLGNALRQTPSSPESRGAFSMGMELSGHPNLYATALTALCQRVTLIMWIVDNFQIHVDKR